MLIMVVTERMGGDVFVSKRDVGQEIGGKGEKDTFPVGIHANNYDWNPVLVMQLSQ